MNKILICLIIWINLSPLCTSGVIFPSCQFGKQFYLSGSIKVIKKFKPDVSVNGKLYLSDPASLRNFYSATTDLYVYKYQDTYNFSIFTNKAGTQYLKASIYEGSLKHQYSLFEIGYLKKMSSLDNLNRKYETECSTLKTESGIALGMNFDQVVNLKGDGYKMHTNKSDTIITYRIEIGDVSGLCEKYNMPGYEMNLTIKNRTVNKISYGFDYP